MPRGGSDPLRASPAAEVAPARGGTMVKVAAGIADRRGEGQSRSADVRCRSAGAASPRTGSRIGPPTSRDPAEGHCPDTATVHGKNRCTSHRPLDIQQTIARAATLRDTPRLREARLFTAASRNSLSGNRRYASRQMPRARSWSEKTDREGPPGRDPHFCKGIGGAAAAIGAIPGARADSPQARAE